MIIYQYVTNPATHAEDLTLKDVDICVEFWGASTKHPDSVCSMRDDVEKGRFVYSDFCTLEFNVFQWMLYVASNKTHVVHAHDTAAWAMELYETLVNATKESRQRVLDGEDTDVERDRYLAFCEVAPRLPCHIDEVNRLLVKMGDNDPNGTYTLHDLVHSADEYMELLTQWYEDSERTAQWCIEGSQICYQIFNANMI